MLPNGIEIRRARPSDIPGIVALELVNQRGQGGELSGFIPEHLLNVMIATMPVIVAVKERVVVGFLLIGSAEQNAGVEVIDAMLSAYPVNPDILLYGPVCVADGVRGLGIAQAMFKALSAISPGMKVLLFIRADNPSSLRAHDKMGMKQVGKFQFHEADHIILTAELGEDRG